MRSFLFIVFYLLSICSFSCKPKNKVDYLSDFNKGGNSLIKDITYTDEGAPLSYYLKKKEIEKVIGLKSLENGVENLQIRIWYGVALSDELQLIYLKKNEDNWTCELYFLKYIFNKNRDSLVSFTKQIEKKVPKSGWEDFIQKLFELKVLVLPDSYQIPNYVICNDGNGITVEIATKNRYKIYNYPCFTSQNEIWEAKNIELILELLENELDFKRTKI